jgi:PPOX class probable F420-dependent enzyme
MALASWGTERTRTVSSPSWSRAFPETPPLDGHLVARPVWTRASGRAQHAIPTSTSWYVRRLVTKQELVALLRKHRLAVQASLSPDGGPQAAVVGIGVGDALEIVFDTTADTRKHQNLSRDPRVALVIGWDHAVTVQIEGTASFPEGDALERARAIYFEAYPDGRDRLAWPGIAHVVVRPTWVRVSDFNQSPPRIEEMSFRE